MVVAGRGNRARPNHSNLDSGGIDAGFKDACTLLALLAAEWLLRALMTDASAMTASAIVCTRCSIFITSYSVINFKECDDMC